MTDAVEVCPECDIAGCRHIRARRDPMSAPELAACPFCGGDRQKIRETGRMNEPWEVFCLGSKERACDAAMWGETQVRAAEEWNRRVDLHDATALDPDMPADELRLHMGELTDQEVLTARAAIRWANSAHAAQVETLREALTDAHGLYQVTHIHARIRAALSAVSREVSDG